MKVVGVVGLPASGKGEFSRVAGEIGIPVVVMGDVIRDEVIRRGLPPTDAEMGRVAGELRRMDGMDAIAQRTIPCIDRCRSPIVIVDGIRGDAEVAAFRKRYPHFLLIGIGSGFEQRACRLFARGRSDDLKSRDELRQRDERELSWGLGRALEGADITLVNEGSIEEFSRDVRTLLGKIRSDP